MDRIQDIEIQQGCCGRCYKVYNLSIQTAGNQQGPEATLTAPKDVFQVRDKIMYLREVSVLGPSQTSIPNRSSSKQPESMDPMTLANSGLLNEILLLKETVLKIEKQIDKGLSKIKS